MGDEHSSTGGIDSELSMSTMPSITCSALPMAATALALTCQDWSELGHGNDPTVAASTELGVTVDRLVAIFFIRIVALLAHRKFLKTGTAVYSDLSTSTICQTALECGTSWDPPISETVVAQLRGYIQRIFQQYKQVSYHNFEHAYHVTISANKLLDIMLHKDKEQKKTYGLKSDPLAHLAVLFSAVIHDVEHQGVPNRQLVLESDRLALLYNDQSVAEQRSLAVAFAELTKDEFKSLREVLFEDVDEYRHFRKTVINLVLTTDIASPERTQIAKSKWKEAFGDTSKKGSYSNAPVHSMPMAGSADADDSSEASTSVTPESYDGFDAREHDCNISPSVAASQSEGDKVLSRTSPHGLTAISPSHSRSVSAPSRTIDDTLIPSFPPHNVLPPHRSKSEVCGFVAQSVKGSSSAHLPEKKRTRAIRRFSMPSAFDMRKAHVRLGIRRSLDLTGETIEPYTGHHPSRSVKSESTTGVPEGSNSDSGMGEEDEPDELRASVVLEQILKAADVAPNMQGWDHMVKWSSRLFFELMDSHEAGRGEDPRNGWFQNQVTFLESYMLPLARRLPATQAFGNTFGPMFVRIVEENRDRWISDGVSLTAEMTQKWIRRKKERSLNRVDNGTV